MAARGPGRVNLIGEHTDYNQGLCLPFAIERGITVTAAGRDDDTIKAHARDLGEHDRFSVRNISPGEGWRAFVRGTVAELAAAGVDVPGAEITLEGDLERGAGLSSSAALESGLCLALLGLAGAPEPDRRELARLCSRVENRWVGAQTGLLDQVAALLGQEGHAMLLDCRDLSVEQVPLALGGWTIGVAASGSRRPHAESGYNERRRECAEACALLGVGSLREVADEDARGLPDPLDRRALHVISENRRVLEAVAALRAGDLPALGRLLDASHASLRDLYEVSVPEVERTVERLVSSGAAGARIMGGGFGGSVVALFAPGGEVPAGVLPVAPAAGANLL